MNSWALASFRHLDDLVVVGIRPAERDVVAHRSAEEHRVLQHGGDLLAPFVPRVVAQVDAVDADSAHARVVEPWNQADQAGFPAAGMSDDADELTRCDFERDIAKNGVFAVVAEGHTLE